MLFAKYILKVTVLLSFRSIVGLGAFTLMAEFAFLFQNSESIERICCILCYTE